MADIPKFMLKPLRDGYSFRLARNVVRTDTIVGLPRERKDSVGKAHPVNATYKCTRAQWQYFLAFTRAYEGLPFLAYLLIDDIDHKWYQCSIVDEYLPVNTKGDQIFTVQLSLVAKPIKYDIDNDILISTLYQMTEGQIELYFQKLAKLVNEDLPDALGGL